MTRALIVAAVSVAATAMQGQRQLRLEKVIDIGCESCGGVTELGKLYDVAVTDSGAMLVVEGDAPMLRVFGRDGRTAWSGGRPGAGPGEYRLPIRAAFGADRSLHIVDMQLRRITQLRADGSVSGTVSLTRFPVVVAARGRSGDLLVLSDDFRGALTLERWSSGGQRPALVKEFAISGEALGNRSLAIAQSGEIALGLDGADYRILRFTPSGDSVATIRRDVARVARTPAEEAELQERLRAGPGHAATERARSKAPRPLIAPRASSTSFKPHFGGDAFRYDDVGRLWVLTMRGNESESIFDVFDRTGAFLVSVTIPGRVRVFSLAGQYLATGREDENGVPIATLWVVR